MSKMMTFSKAQRPMRFRMPHQNERSDVRIIHKSPVVGNASLDTEKAVGLTTMQCGSVACRRTPSYIRRPITFAPVSERVSSFIQAAVKNKSVTL